MTDYFEDMFYTLFDITFSIFFNGGWIVLLIILRFSSMPQKDGSDYFEIAKEQTQLTHRKNQFFKRYLLFLFPSWGISCLILPNSQLGLFVLFLPFTMVLTTLATISLLFSIKGMLLFIIASLIVLSKISTNLKIISYSTILLLITIISPEHLYLICFNTINCIIHASIEIIQEKGLFLDKNECVLSNKQIILRNTVKFLCLYVAIIPLIYYMKTKDILWDKLTDIRYVSPL